MVVTICFSQLRLYLHHSLTLSQDVLRVMLLSCQNDVQCQELEKQQRQICSVSVLHCTYCMSSRRNIISDCCVLAVSFLTVAWMTITPVSIFWGAFLPLHAAWSVYDRPLLSPVFITFIPMMLLKFPLGYPVRLF